MISGGKARGSKELGDSLRDAIPSQASEIRPTPFPKPGVPRLLLLVRAALQFRLRIHICHRSVSLVGFFSLFISFSNGNHSPSLASFNSSFVMPVSGMGT